MKSDVITPELSVNETIHRHPRSVQVFNRFGVDACCGGASSLAEAAARDGVSLAELMDALRQEAAP
jgi:iron-sulfur cluster repair protein YtfE (RIC family)